MSLTKHGKYFWLDVRIKGKRIRRSLRTGNRNLALDRYGAMKERLLEKHGEGQVTFSDFKNKYLDWKWQTSPNSAEREEPRLWNIQAFFDILGLKYLLDIKPYHIEQLKIKLGEDGKLSKTTINYYLQALRCLYNKAIDWEAYDKPNPLKKVQFYKIQRSSKGLSHTEIGKILEIAKKIKEKPRSPLQKVFYDLCIFAINTGMRRSEILYLKWKDVKGDTLYIKGKGDKHRFIPINEKVRMILSRHPRRFDYVFDIPNRHQVNVFLRTIDKIRKETGVDFSFHSFRHYFSTTLLEKGVDIVTIGEILGHSRIGTSLLYAHTDKEKMQRAVDLLEKI